MSEFIGLVLISISILGLAYSIGNLVTINPCSITSMSSLKNLEYYYAGLMASKQRMLEKVE